MFIFSELQRSKAHNLQSSLKLEMHEEENPALQKTCHVMILLGILLTC